MVDALLWAMARGLGCWGSGAIEYPALPAWKRTTMADEHSAWQCRHPYNTQHAPSFYNKEAHKAMTTKTPPPTPRKRTVAQAAPRPDHVVTTPVHPARTPAPSPAARQLVDHQGRTWTDYARPVPTPVDLAYAVEQNESELAAAHAAFVRLGRGVRQMQQDLGQQLTRAATVGRVALGLGVLALLVGCGLWLAHGTREAGATPITAPSLPRAAAPRAPASPVPTVAPVPEIVPVRRAVDRTVQPGEGIAAYEERMHLPAGAVRLWLGLQGRTTLFAGEEPDPAAVQAAARVLTATPIPTPAPERPVADDPTIDSGGSFGGWSTGGQGTEQPHVDDPTIDSGGSFGGGQQVAPPVVDAGPAVAAPPAPAAPQYDDPAIASGGSFGGGQATPAPVVPTYDDPTIHSGGSFGRP